MWHFSSSLILNPVKTPFLSVCEPKAKQLIQNFVTILGLFPVNPCLTVIEQHCCLTFSLEQMEGDILPTGRENSPGYVTQTTKMQNFVLTV
jgi:hypothetical protein